MAVDGPRGGSRARRKAHGESNQQDDYSDYYYKDDNNYQPHQPPPTPVVIRCYACYYRWKQNDWTGVKGCSEPFDPYNIPIVNCSGSCGVTLPTVTFVIIITRMVQLPATAAIEYVAACWVTGAGFFCLVRGSFARGHFWPGDFWPGRFLSGGAFVQGSFVRGDFCPGGLCPFPQVQCVYELSRLSVPSIVARRTNKKTKKNKQKDKLGPVAPRGVDPRSPNFQGM